MPSYFFGGIYQFKKDMPHYGIKRGFKYHFKFTGINPCVLESWCLIAVVLVSLLRWDFVLRHGEQWSEYLCPPLMCVL